MSALHVTFALLYPLNSLNYVGKELTVQDTSERSCIRSSLLCGTNWACEETTWGTQAIPPHPTPLFVSDLLSGVQENRGGKGRSRCWSSPASWAPTAFSHGSDPSYMSDAPVISDGPPFYREHAPVGALDTETYLPASETTELGGGGERERGGVSRRGARLGVGGGGGGGWGEKSICDLKHLLSWEKTQRTVLLVPPHFFPK